MGTFINKIVLGDRTFINEILLGEGTFINKKISWGGGGGEGRGDVYKETFYLGRGRL